MVGTVQGGRAEKGAEKGFSVHRITVSGYN